MMKLRITALKKRHPITFYKSKSRNSQNRNKHGDPLGDQDESRRISYGVNMIDKAVAESCSNRISTMETSATEISAAIVDTTIALALTIVRPRD